MSDLGWSALLATWLMLVMPDSRALAKACGWSFRSTAAWPWLLALSVPLNGANDTFGVIGTVFGVVGGAGMAVTVVVAIMRTRRYRS